MRRAARLALAAGLSLAFASARARANPLDTFGFGSRGTAMGDAQVADASDFSANYYNPAGLARAERFEIAVGYFHAEHQFRTNGQDNGVDSVSGLVGGFVLPGRVFGVPVAFGFGLHLPDERLSRLRDLPQSQPRWELYDNRNQRLYLAANLAVAPWPWLEIGGGVSFMASADGSLDISGEANVFNPSQSQLRDQVDADLTAVRYPQLGARVHLGKRAAIALVYRGQFALNSNLSARLYGDISHLTTAYYALKTASVDAFMPQQVVIGGSFLPHDRLKVDVDFTWLDWSAYATPVASLDVTLDIPPPAGGWPAGISPPGVPAPTQVVPLKMSDRIVPHVGVEWLAFERGKFAGFVRAGYEFQKSPIAPQTGPTNYIDRDRHTGALGFGFRIDKPAAILQGDLRLDLHAQLSVLPDALTMKINPADPVGDYVAGGVIWNLGATMLVGF